MKVYVASAGSYSDWHIIGIFATREEAEMYRDAMSNDENDIEEYEIGQLHDRIKAGYKVFSIWMLIETGQVQVVNINGEEFQQDSPRVTVKEFPKDTMYVQCWAKNEEEAIKIATDIRRAELAKPQEKESDQF